MTQETKQCQNCKNQFNIESDDFDFYKKIDVPPPTWCPECRMIRRLIWRNEHTLYKRKCNASGHNEDIISMYPPESPYTVYDHEFWYSDDWDSMEYGQEYDFSKPFFEQFRELLKRVPKLALFDSKSTNSKYINITVEHKNCYLVTAGWGNEDSMYSNRISFCKDTIDSYVCHKTEFGYENVYCKDSYQLLYSLRSQNCNNSYFLYDCVNCSDCVGCTNLRNKQYHIFNQPYSKEEYQKKLKELDLESPEGISKVREKFNEMRLKALNRYAQLINTTNVLGDNVEESRNCYYCFDLAGEAENSKYSHWGTYGLKDSYDTGPGTGGNSGLLYEGISIGVKNANCRFGVIVWYSHDVEYGFNCQDSEYLFGCVGVRKKKYCILNKQYSKEEYNELLPKIKKQMNDTPYTDSKGRVYKYGEFFPPDISTSAYNEAVTLDYFPLTKEQAIEKGYRWRDSDEKQHKPTIAAEDIPTKIGDVEDNITNEVLECTHKGKCEDDCTKAFRVTSQELQFYRKLKIPLPILCPNCRHSQRLKQRNPFKLWHRQCMCDYQVYNNTAKHSHHETGRCPNEFETSYSPERKEIVYCEKCYQAEVV